MNLKTEQIKVKKEDNSILKIDLIQKGSGSKKVCILNGLHGLEKSGALLGYEVFKHVKTTDFTITFIPFANPPTFENNVRLTPEDNKDLNRCFPGDPNGTLTDRIAYSLYDCLKDYDLVIDIHNFPRMRMPVVGVFFNRGSQEIKQKSLSHILNLNPNYIWKLDTSIDEKNKAGALIEALLENNVPSFAMEAPDIELITSSQISKIVKGIEEMLKKFDTVVVPKSVPVITRVAAVTETSGIFIPKINLNEVIDAGNVVGDVVDLSTFKVTPVKAPITGPIVFILNRTTVSAGDRVVLVGNCVDFIL